LLFMGEEWAASQPFLFFCDFHDELADAVREGRRREFERFPEFRDATTRERIPDPNAPETFMQCVLDWTEPDRAPHTERRAFYRELLRLRRDEIVPRLPGMAGHAATIHPIDGALWVNWMLGDGSTLHLIARLAATARCGSALPVPGRRLFSTDPSSAPARGELPPWTVIWHLDETP
jgi:1,4-alpha-glucan branching enzyme